MSLSVLLCSAHAHGRRLTDEIIGDAGAKAIAQELSTNTTVQELDLACAFVDDVFQFAPPR